MKRYLLFLGLIAALGLGSISVLAQGNGNGLNKLICFSGTDDGGIYGGTCTYSGNGSKRKAILNTDDGDPDGSYAGTYSNNQFIYGRQLSSIEQLSFVYSGDAPDTGSPRFSVPVDTDADGDTDIFAFVSAYYCDDGSGEVSATNAGCTIFTSDFGVYAGISALTAAYPGARIAEDNLVFIISDAPGNWTIISAKFGNPGNGHN